MPVRRSPSPLWAAQLCPRSPLTAIVVVVGLWLPGCGPDAHLPETDRARIRAPGAADAARVASERDANTDPSVLGPARLGPLEVTVLADCARVQITATRPVSAVVHLEFGGIPSQFPLGNGATLFDQAFRVGASMPGPARVHVSAVDGEGAIQTTAPVEVMGPPAARGFAITELLANPAGTEARQEYVEVANLAAEPLSTAGLRIEDGAGEDPLPTVNVPPGGRFLVVGTSFDEQGGLDVAPAAGTLILRVPGRIGRDGLGQKGEVIRLRDADQRIESIYGGWIDTSRPVWAGHSVQRQPDSACDHPAAWSRSPQVATPGW